MIILQANNKIMLKLSFLLFFIVSVFSVEVNINVDGDDDSCESLTTPCFSFIKAWSLRR
jgi:hypothetical protein